MDPCPPETFEALFDVAPTPVVLCRRRMGRVVIERLNAAAEAMMRGDDGRTAATLVELARTAVDEQEALRRSRLVLPHRSGRSYQARAQPIDHSTAAVFVEDVTDHLARRDALSMWHDIADRLDDGFVICTLGANTGDPATLPVIASNGRMHVIAGTDRLQPDATLGSMLADVFGPSDFGRLAQLATARTSTETNWRIERQSRAWRCRAWTLDERLVVQLSDLTERGQLARALSDHARLLRVANDELDQVVQALRRAVREPMRQVLELGRRLQASLPARHQGDMTTLMRLGRRIEITVGDLLAYTSITRTPLTGGTIELERVLERALETLDAQLVHRRVTIRHQPLPTVWGQERLLEILMTQLITHALTWSTADHPLVIDIDARHVDGVWRITVSGDAAKTDHHQLQGMLDAFQPGQGATLGMGLAICRRIVEHHGGEIGADARPGGGALLWFDLPTVQAAMR